MPFCRRFVLSCLISLSATCARPDTVAPQALVLHDLTVVDVVEGRLLPHHSVVVRGGRIVAVGPAATVPAPAGALVVEGNGRFLIPGLWDMHTHSLWDPEFFRLFLHLGVSQGITGIRDMGGTLPVLAQARDSLRTGRSLFPRIAAAGNVVDGPEPVDPSISIAVADSTGAVRAVDSLVRHGADFIKVYTLLPRAAWFAVMAEARRRGVPVEGHVPADVTVEEAAEAGQKSIEHLRDEIEPFCAPAAAEACGRLAEVFRRQGTWQVPTLDVLRMKGVMNDSAVASDPRLDRIPAPLRDTWLGERTRRLKRGGVYFGRKRVRFQEELWLVGFLHREGVGILAGTDAGNSFIYPGYSMVDELALLVEAGLTPLDALRAATLRPAEFLAARDSMGSVAVGQVADLVLLEGDPLLDIHATGRVSGVVLRGRWLGPADLRRLQE